MPWIKNGFATPGAIILFSLVHRRANGFKRMARSVAPGHLDSRRRSGECNLALGTQKNLAENLGCPIRLLGVIDTRDAYGQWQVYHIRWPEKVVLQ